MTGSHMEFGAALPGSEAVDGVLVCDSTSVRHSRQVGRSVGHKVSKLILHIGTN